MALQSFMILTRFVSLKHVTVLTIYVVFSLDKRQFQPSALINYLHLIHGYIQSYNNYFYGGDASHHYQYWY